HGTPDEPARGRPALRAPDAPGPPAVPGTHTTVPRTGASRATETDPSTEATPRAEAAAARTRRAALVASSVPAGMAVADGGRCVPRRGGRDHRVQHRGRRRGR